MLTTFHLLCLPLHGLPLCPDCALCYCLCILSVFQCPWTQSYFRCFIGRQKVIEKALFVVTLLLPQSYIFGIISVMALLKTLDWNRELFPWNAWHLTPNLLQSCGSLLFFALVWSTKTLFQHFIHSQRSLPRSLFWIANFKWHPCFLSNSQSTGAILIMETQIATSHYNGIKTPDPPEIDLIIQRDETDSLSACC